MYLFYYIISNYSNSHDCSVFKLNYDTLYFKSTVIDSLRDRIHAY